MRMGFLALGTPLAWEDAKKSGALESVRRSGVAQFISLYYRVKNRRDDVLRWGDEVCCAVPTLLLLARSASFVAPVLFSACSPNLGLTNSAPPTRLRSSITYSSLTTLHALCDSLSARPKCVRVARCILLAPRHLPSHPRPKFRAHSSLVRGRGRLPPTRRF